MQHERVFQSIITWIGTCGSERKTCFHAYFNFNLLFNLLIPQKYESKFSEDVMESVSYCNDELLTIYIYLKYIDAISGWGLFAMKPIPPNINLVPYLGELISTTEKDRRSAEKYDKHV
jgi:hypothetical protein